MKDEGGSIIGQTLAHYRIIRRLGKGGMGEVYLAEDTVLKREVAIKVLPASLRNDPERLRRFRREAEARDGIHNVGAVMVLPVRHTLHLLKSADIERNRNPDPGGYP